MAQINLGSNKQLPYTQISNSFIDKYMLEANPVFSVIYIYMLRMIQQNNFSLDTKDIAAKFNLLESDVVNCLKYWDKEKIIKYIQNDDCISINFIDILEDIDNSIKIGKEVTLVNEKQNKVIIDDFIDQKDKKVNNMNFSITKPRYSPQEIEIYQKESNDIKKMFKLAEQSLGKLLSFNDLSVIFSFYDWLRLPIEVIEKLLTYCTSNGHRSLNYIERVAIDWAENNINSLQSANDYIEKFSSTYSKILHSLGIIGRVATKTEIVFMKKWIDEFKMPLDVIIEACSRTVLNTGSSSFFYCDKVITTWNNNNVKTLEEINIYDKGYKINSNDETKKIKKPNRNKIVNYVGYNWDYDKLEELEQKYLENSLEG